MPAGVPNHPVECRKCHQLRARPKDRLCPSCLPVALGITGRNKRFYWTPFLDEQLRAIYAENGRKRKLSAALAEFRRRTGFNTPACQRRAHTLGITQKRWRTWTPSEIEFLEAEAGRLSIRKMAKKLRRTPESVKQRLFLIGRSGQVSEGYSLNELKQLLGMSADTLRRCVREGMLRGRHLGPHARFSDHEVERFIRTYPHLWDLRRVDQAWFKGLLFPMFNSVDALDRGAKRPPASIVQEMEEVRA